MLKFIILLLLSTQLYSSNVKNLKEDAAVYICVSSGATKYHYNRNCHGLNRCTHEIRKVSLTEARSKYKRTLCGYED
ncbi:MAG: hypothetical protein KDC84_13975 [Crocinitomicaceae bacterium]|nr:hypothetical protein [Crocinitomicaceae bacterium]